MHRVRHPRHSLASGFIAGIMSYILINWSILAINFVQVRSLAARLCLPAPAGAIPLVLPLLHKPARNKGGPAPHLPSPSLPPSAQAKMFPNSVDPTLKHAGTWRIACQMTFHLNAEDDASSNGKSDPMDDHHMPPPPAEAPEGAAAKV